jgi:hypothetical protein
MSESGNPYCFIDTEKSPTKSTDQIGLGNKLPTLGKPVQLFVIIFLILLGLSGSKNILGKKRAWLLFSI